MHKGSCQCGAVSFEVEGPLGAPDACHCSICRKLSSHHYAGTEVSKGALTIAGAENITWYHSSDKVRRGFCTTCGAPMFFEPRHRDWIGVSMGVLDQPTGTKLALHIFVADKGDYYEITDGLPQNAQ